ncbi:MAG TPA: hypothetical protein VHD90_12255 [Phototrophicaceae bacterium]|nr:hypothetical protein [Phototrophicaceae bacterium]
MTVRRTFLILIIAMLAVPLIIGNVRANQNAQQAQQQQQPQGQTGQTAQGGGGFTGAGGNGTGGNGTGGTGGTGGNGFRQFQQQATEEANTGISALGSVAANATVSINFQGSGTVSGVYVQVGDYVDAGDVLADMDGTSAWSTYNQAQLNLQKAQLALEELNQPPSEDDLKVAEANLASAQAAYGSTANNAQTSAQITADQEKYQSAQANLAALQQARQNMSGTDDQIAMQDAKIGAASFNAEIARLTLQKDQTPDSSSLWSASIRIQQAQLNLQKLQAGPTMQQLDSANVAVVRAEAAVADAETALQNLQLIAPRAGYVIGVNIKTNDAVGNGAGVTSTTSTSATTSGDVELADVSQFKISVPVNELDIEKVKIGDTADITLDSLPGTNFTGKVDNISWLATTDSNGIVTYAVEIVLNTDDPRVKIGMTGEITINTTGTSTTGNNSTNNNQSGNNQTGNNQTADTPPAGFNAPDGAPPAGLNPPDGAPTGNGGSAS